MKYLLLIAIFFAFTIGAKAQCVATPTDTCVTVHQSTLDRVAKDLDELTAARATIAAFTNERAMTDKERETVKSAFATVDAAMTILQKGIADRDKVIELQDKLFQAVQQLNDRLMEQIGKGKTGWQKFVATFRDIALIAAGITFGRGHL